MSIKKKRRIIAFDLETIADKKMVPFLPEVKPNGSLKDPKKIEADIEEKKKNQIFDMGLNPLTNIICCAGWCDENGPGSIMLKDEDSEKDLLHEFWEVLSGYDHFVTFNGRAFDLRCLYLHGMAHDVKAAVNIERGRYNKGNHTDIRLVLAGDDKFASGTLDFFSQKFLGSAKTEGIDGKLVQGYWDMELREEIAEYCMQDCKLTYQLYIKAEKAGLLE